MCSAWQIFSLTSIFSSFLSRYRKMNYEKWKTKLQLNCREKRRKTRNFHCDCRQPRKMLIRLQTYRAPATCPYPFPTLAADYIWGKSTWQASLDDFTATFYLLPRVPNFCVPYMGGRWRIVMYYVGCWDWKLQSILVWIYYLLYNYLTFQC